MPSQPKLTKIVLLLTTSLTVMAGAAVAPAMPLIREAFADYPNSFVMTQMILIMPALLIVCCGPVAGFIIDRFGRKTPLCFSLAVYGAAGISPYFMNNLYVILASRAILGLAVAGTMTATTTLIADYYEDEMRKKIMGLQGAFMGLGGTLFVMVSGFLAMVDWHTTFLIYLLAFVIFPCALIAVWEPERTSAEDAAAGKTAAAGDGLPWALLAMLYASSFACMVIFFLIPVQLPFYLNELFNAPSSRTGMAIGFYSLISAVFSSQYKLIKAKLSYQTIFFLSFVFMGVGYVAMSGIGTMPQAYGALALAGVGIGLIMPNISVYLAAEVSERFRGRAMGGLTSSFFLGQVFSLVFSYPAAARWGIGATYRTAGAGSIFIAVFFLIAAIRDVRVA